VQVFDFVIIGAGVVGLTTAHELMRRFPGSRVAVLEKEPEPGRHASGRNSGVLHSGIYYGSDTLKARVCSRGAARMMAFADEHGIPFRRSGKVIIATGERDLPTIELLLGNARANGIRAERLDERGIRDIEPHAAPYRTGIWSPDTAVIDSWAVLNRLHALLVQAGVQLRFNEPVTDVMEDGRCLATPVTRYEAGYFFNCAGAHADRIAKRFGVGNGYALVPFKGLYYKLRDDRRELVRSNIYPVPDMTVPFLGVHLTRVISGEVFAGPTAIPALGRENYGLIEGLRVGEAARVGWQLGRLYISNEGDFRGLVHGEIAKYRKAQFVESVRRLVPDIHEHDLVRADKVGIRPQLVNVRTSKLEMDFVIEAAPRSLHVLNAISPAFTSSLAFAELLVNRYEAATGTA